MLKLVLCLAFMVTSMVSAYNIGAFNIQIFGLSKMGKPNVVNVLLDILVRYDMVLIQEIRDSSETAIVDLLTQLNQASSSNYLMAISERLGRTSSKEQYAFFYKDSIFSLVTTRQYPVVYDFYERPPYVAVFDASGIGRFAYAALHAKPDDAVSEIDILVDVYDEIAPDIGVYNWIIAGDLNAGCDYVKPSDWPNIRLRNDNRFQWLIGDSVKTNVALSKDCAYDRYVTVNMRYGQANAYYFDAELGVDPTLTLETSDHYPVEAEIY